MNLGVDQEWPAYRAPNLRLHGCLAEISPRQSAGRLLAQKMTEARIQD